jgi:hypothetical protein
LRRRGGVAARRARVRGEGRARRRAPLTCAPAAQARRCGRAAALQSAGARRGRRRRRRERRARRRGSRR